MQERRVRPAKMQKFSPPFLTIFVFFVRLEGKRRVDNLFFPYRGILPSKSKKVPLGMPKGILSGTSSINRRTIAKPRRAVYNIYEQGMKERT